MLDNAPRALITGGGSGLGRALALRLARRNARLLIADIHLERAEETVALARQRGARAEAIRCDVSKLEDLEAAARKIDELYGGIDLLVNNAGVAVAGPVGDLPIEDWDWILRTNLWGPIYGCHVFVPRMKAQRSGYILNVASSAGFASLPEMGAYNVTKAGVIALSETLDAELAPYGIKVSVLCPTFFKTNLLETLRATTDEQRASAQAMFDRASMTADEVAEAALRGLERGELIIIPQLDGKLVWRAKRFGPELYRKVIRQRALIELLSPANKTKPKPSTA